MKAARACGGKGRSPSLDGENPRMPKSMVKSRELSVGSLAHQFSVSRRTLYELARHEENSANNTSGTFNRAVEDMNRVKFAAH